MPIYSEMLFLFSGMTSRGKLLVQLALSQSTSWATPEPEAEVILQFQDNEGRLDYLESDAVSEHSVHVTDLEQSADLSEIDYRSFSPSEVRIGKDKTTKWRLTGRTVRRRREH